MGCCKVQSNAMYVDSLHTLQRSARLGQKKVRHSTQWNGNQAQHGRVRMPQTVTHQVETDDQEMGHNISDLLLDSLYSTSKESDVKTVRIKIKAATCVVLWWKFKVSWWRGLLVQGVKQFLRFAF